MHLNAPILLRNIFVSVNMELFVESIIDHGMHCQLCWIVASMVHLDSKTIADAIVCACKELLRNLSE